jgi:hypothetical protein
MEKYYQSDVARSKVLFFFSACDILIRLHVVQ